MIMKLSSEFYRVRSCLKIGYGGIFSFWNRKERRVWMNKSKYSSTKSEPSSSKKRLLVAFRSHNFYTICWIRMLISDSIFSLFWWSSKIVHFRIASTRTGSLFYCNNFCKRRLVSFSFFSSLDITGKAANSASLILCEILRIRSVSSDRVVIITKIISRKWLT